ncbi:MAG: hypothetical protein ACYC26_15685 [Phycisphaerales bacterium]
MSCSHIQAVLAGLLIVVLSQVCRGQTIEIQNASFENASGGGHTGAEAAAPSGWLWSTPETNVSPDTGYPYATLVENGVIAGKDGNNYLAVKAALPGGGVPQGVTVFAWVPSVALGTYQEDTVYTLRVAQASSTGDTHSFGAIALLADGQIAASRATCFADLRSGGVTAFQDCEVILDTNLHPQFVGRTISARLMYQGEAGAQYVPYAYFDNVRLVTAPSPLVDIRNASFENAAGGTHTGVEAAPVSSWLWSTPETNVSPGTGYPYATSVDTAAYPGKHGNHFLTVKVAVPNDGVPAGTTVSAWVPSETLGTYQPDTLYTLTVAQTAGSTQPESCGTIALLADDVIVASRATSFSVLRGEGAVFHDYQVTLDTIAHPELVGRPLRVRLMYQGQANARYVQYAYFDHVRLRTDLLDPYNHNGWDNVVVTPPDPNPQLGMNLAGWDTEQPCVDLFRMGRLWISHRIGETVWGSGPALDLDQHGWVRMLEPDCYVETILGVMGAGAEHYPSGDYTVLYEGEGQMTFSSNATIVDASQPGRILLHVDSTLGSLRLNITQTNPANYIRNIHVIMPGRENTWQTDHWRADFLQRWAGVACFRFMDWGRTNNSPIVRWSDRPTLDDSVFRLHHGVPLEMMIDLCNRQHINPWFCMPHQADDDFIRQYATMVRDNLDPNLKIHIEYSNEVWNTGFQQNAYAQQKAVELGLGGSSSEGACLFYVQRAVEIFKIWEEVFGGKDRLARVLAWQAASDPNVWLDGLLLANTQPGDVDVLAIAPYMSFTIPATSNDPGVPSAEQVAAWSVDQVLDYVERTALPNSILWISRARGVADKYGMYLVAYESGQHLVGVYGGENNDALTALLQQANAHPRMGQLYTDYYNAWRNGGGDLMCAFDSMSAWTKWGSWGLLQYTDDDPAAGPKFMSTMRWALSLGQPVNVPWAP